VQFTQYQGKSGSQRTTRYFVQSKIFKFSLLCFWAPFGGLRATYDDPLSLIGKRVVDFLLVLIERFSLCVTAKALRSNIGSKSAISFQRGSADRKFQVEEVAHHQPFFLSEN